MEPDSHPLLTLVHYPFHYTNVFLNWSDHRITPLAFRTQREQGWGVCADSAGLWPWAGSPGPWEPGRCGFPDLSSGVVVPWAQAGAGSLHF